MLLPETFAFKIWTVLILIINCLKICKTNILEWAGLCRSIPLSLGRHDRYSSINSPAFVVGDNIFDVTKGKWKDYYTLLIREKAKPPNIIQKLQSNFHFNSDHLKQILKLPHSIVVKSCVKASPIQYKVINPTLSTHTKLYKIGFRTNDLFTFCDNQPESLTHLFYHCSRSKKFWIEFELYWCFISNQRIRLLKNVLRGRISSVGRAFECRTGGRGFDSRGRTITKGLKMTEKWRYFLCTASG